MVKPLAQDGETKLTVDTMDITQLEGYSSQISLITGGIQASPHKIAPFVLFLVLLGCDDASVTKKPEGEKLCPKQYTVGRPVLNTDIERGLDLIYLGRECNLRADFVFVNETEHAVENFGGLSSIAPNERITRTAGWGVPTPAGIDIKDKKYIRTILILQIFYNPRPDDSLANEFGLKPLVDYPADRWREYDLFHDDHKGYLRFDEDHCVGYSWWKESGEGLDLKGKGILDIHNYEFIQITPLHVEFTYRIREELYEQSVACETGPWKFRISQDYQLDILKLP